jgi:hypothetical protein
MSTAMIVVVVIGSVIVVGSVTICALALVRRREVQHRFGPEYGRVVGESGNDLKAESGLKERERRVRELDIRPLADSAREGYTDQWAAIRAQFAEAPAAAVAASHVLVIAILNERGYPTGRAGQLLADLSVDHAGILDRYRSAAEISRRAAAGTASTEDLRLALVDYRAIFRDLLGEGDVQAGSAAADERSVGPMIRR